MEEKAALIIVTHNNWDKLSDCLISIYKHTNFPYHIFLIDNASTDNTTVLYDKDYPNMTIVRNEENKWWSGGINQGIDLSKDYKYVFFLNDDIVVGKSWLINHLVPLQSPNIAGVGPHNSHPRDSQCYDNAMTKEYGKAYLPIIGDEVDRNDLDKMNELLYEHNLKNFPNRPYLNVIGMVAFFCVGFKREVIDQIGYLDENLIMGGDDDDYCMRIKHETDLKMAILLNTYVIHNAGSSINKKGDKWKKEMLDKNMAYLKKKWPNVKWD